MRDFVKDLQISEPIPHAQPMVGLELASVARAADALKIFTAIWITGVQSSDDPRWHYVVHMPPDSCLLEIHPACFNLTLPPQSWRPQTPPPFPPWATPRPLPVNAAPTYWPLLDIEARPAVEASSVAIRAVAAVHRFEHFCSSVSTIWTTHVLTLPSLGS
jgi:hypothetical protein